MKWEWGHTRHTPPYTQDSTSTASSLPLVCLLRCCHCCCPHMLCAHPCILLSSHAVCSSLHPVVPSRLSFVASLRVHEGPVTAIATSPTMGDIVTACPNSKYTSVGTFILMVLPAVCTNCRHTSVGTFILMVSPAVCTNCKYTSVGTFILMVLPAVFTNHHCSKREVGQCAPIVDGQRLPGC